MNEKLEELLNISPDDATKEDNDALIEEIKNAQLILPIEITSKLEIDDAEIGDVIEIEWTGGREGSNNISPPKWESL